MKKINQSLSSFTIAVNWLPVFYGKEKQYSYRP